MYETTYPYLVLHRAGFAKPPKSPPTLVGSYSTVSPLPKYIGGLLSVALSVNLLFLQKLVAFALRSALLYGVRTFLISIETQLPVIPACNSLQRRLITFLIVFRKVKFIINEFQYEYELITNFYS